MFQSFVAKLRPGANDLLEIVGIEHHVGAHSHAPRSRV